MHIILIVEIVAVTARAMVGDEQLIRASGADHYLSKPYKYQSLCFNPISLAFDTLRLNHFR